MLTQFIKIGHQICIIRCSIGPRHVSSPPQRAPQTDHGIRRSPEPKVTWLSWRRLHLSSWEMSHWHTLLLGQRRHLLVNTCLPESHLSHLSSPLGPFHQAQVVLSLAIPKLQQPRRAAAQRQTERISPQPRNGRHAKLLSSNLKTCGYLWCDPKERAASALWAHSPCCIWPDH
jgi:hypothetical protein